jgi:NADH-quinone oxidoreductase subunit L
LDGNVPHAIHWDIVLQGTLAAAIGIAVAAWIYAGTPGLAGRLSRALGGAYRLSLNRFYFDECLWALVVAPLRKLADWLLLAERKLIDALLDGIARLPGRIGGRVRPLQSGLVQSYALMMLAGLALFVVTMLVSR